MNQSRIRALDAGRGMAMLFVFLSHFNEYYLGSHGRLTQLHFLYRFTMIATPTFILISGITLGYLFSVKKTDFRLTRRKYIDRGLFLVTIAHIMIMLSWSPMLKYFHSSNIFRIMFVTDTIGICFIIGPVLISIIKPNLRIALSILFYIISWLIISRGNTKNIYLNDILESFFGELHRTVFTDNFPVLPWLSLYFFGTVIGEKITVYLQNNLQKDLTILFLRYGLFSIGLSFIFILIHKFLIITGVSTFNETFNDFISSTQKNPPGLVYFMFYSGAGLILLAILNYIAVYELFKVIIMNLEIIGKASLFSFILQYFIYFSVLVWINPPYMKIWPILFILSMFINIVLIKFWYKEGLNKYLTILNISVWDDLFFKRSK
jgi:uncharacterized membrane protein